MRFLYVEIISIIIVVTMATAKKWDIVNASQVGGAKDVLRKKICVTLIQKVKGIVNNVMVVVNVSSVNMVGF